MTIYLSTYCYVNVYSDCKLPQTWLFSHVLDRRYIYWEIHKSLKKVIDQFNELRKPTFFGEGGGCRFLFLSSFDFFAFSFSDKITKKWLHLSHLTNLDDAMQNHRKTYLLFQSEIQLLTHKTVNMHTNITAFWTKKCHLSWSITIATS